MILAFMIRLVNWELRTFPFQRSIETSGFTHTGKLLSHYPNRTGQSFSLTLTVSFAPEFNHAGDELE